MCCRRSVGCNLEFAKWTNGWQRSLVCSTRSCYRSLRVLLHRRPLVQVHVDLQAQGVRMHASARSLASAGYLCVWDAATGIRNRAVEQPGKCPGEEDPIDPTKDATAVESLAALAAEEEQYRALQSCAVGDKVTIVDVKARQCASEAPRRYSEAGLVNQLERLGIGRPATYSAIVGALTGGCTHAGLLMLAWSSLHPPTRFAQACSLRSDPTSAARHCMPLKMPTHSTLQ